MNDDTKDSLGPMRRAIQKAVDSANVECSSRRSARNALVEMRKSDPRLAHVTTIVDAGDRTWRLQGAPLALAFLLLPDFVWVLCSTEGATVVDTDGTAVAVLVPAASCLEFGGGDEAFALYQLSTRLRAADAPECAG